MRQIVEQNLLVDSVLQLEVEPLNAESQFHFPSPKRPRLIESL